MPYETLLLEVEEAIATITLNRPQVLNALNAQLFTDLDAAITTLSSNAEIRAIILTGAGEKAFAAGADISELAQTDATTGETLALRGQAVFTHIETCGKPVIAAINGFALGGGCELALACTLRLASETARIGQPEVKLGLLPGYGGSQRLPRLIGPSAALKLLLTGDMIPAPEALRLGLVDDIHPPANLLPAALALAKKIAAQAPLAVQACLEAVHQGADLPLNKALALEAHLFGRLSATEDKKEGTAAFLAKRPPTWTGR
ncbi:enoyl-CoA hydratase-related protein [Granulicella tundricola]|uniref:Enoyl-CoA hydratase/isomerase n=1 Tax=Granulicella tundricola (strain ATCC BAA-1859 / DSM 23138 / MP5ACTX9) TaxID=1198114 RepID=E8WZL5_GRATM|nr:enoyl-CoA hydratase-related protein [Granulicella tundricola]ADW69989.1 Enoyl-CoA hydratase/isomerase [Granulicella tundricola MP5ACTX9]